MVSVVNFINGMASALGAGTHTNGVRELTASDLAYVGRMESAIRDRHALYRQYQAYYDGLQRDPRSLLDSPTDVLVSGIEPRYDWRPAHNICEPVVDRVVDRLQVRGWIADDAGENEPAKASELIDRLARWWKQGRMDEVQQTVHAQARIKGDSFLMLDWDNARGIPRATYNDGLFITPVYAADNVTLEAVYKVWTERYNSSGVVRDRTRLIIYEPSIITKWVSESISASDVSGWRVYEDDGDGGVIPWMFGGQPLGVPVIHFRNKPRGSAFGRSALAAVIPVQDEFNRRIWDASIASAYGGNRQIYASNVHIERPAVGTTAAPTQYVRGPGRMWIFQPEDAARPVNVGTIESDNVLDLQEGAERELRLLTFIAGIPAHMIWPTGGLPSGESLRAAQVPLIGICQSSSVTWGDPWEDMAQYWIRLNNAFRPRALLPTDITLSTVWARFDVTAGEAETYRSGESTEPETFTLVAKDGSNVGE